MIDRRYMLAGLAALASTPLAAQPIPRDPARLRLVAGPQEGPGRHLAALHVTLMPGWKTYWRFPGDSGIPPRADFTGSENLRSATLLFPAPERSSFDGGEVLGYRREVTLPIRVLARDPARPVRLALAFDYGVCERVCIPASARLSTALGGASPAQADRVLVERALARVPRPVSPGTAVEDIAFSPEDGRLSFRARLAAGVSLVAVEGPEPWGAGMTTLSAPASDGSVAVAMRFRRFVPGQERAEGVRITVVGPGDAVEETRRLD
jgi:DsbC/DsbD-like thiol-disulfide interchange protein